MEARRAAAEAARASARAEAAHESKEGQLPTLTQAKAEAEAWAEKAMEESARLDKALAALG